MSIPVFKIKTNKNDTKWWSTVIQIFVLGGIILGAYWLGVFISTKNSVKVANNVTDRTSDADDTSDKLKEKDEELTKKIETVNQRLDNITTNPYDFTPLGGCTRLYPTYPYYSYSPYYPYARRSSPYTRKATSLANWQRETRCSLCCGLNTKTAKLNGAVTTYGRSTKTRTPSQK